MGARGRLKLVENLQAVPAAIEGTAAADVQPLAPEKPKSVSEHAAMDAAWDAIVPKLAAAGLVSAADGPAIEICLMHFILAGRAFLEVGDTVVVDDPAHGGGTKKNPAEAVFRLESAAFLEYAKQLGMTFVSRVRTPSAQQGETDANPFQANLG